MAELRVIVTFNQSALCMDNSARWLVLIIQYHHTPVLKYMIKYSISMESDPLYL